MSNHNAKVSNFDNHEEIEGISIVVASAPNGRLSNDGKTYRVKTTIKEFKPTDNSGKKKQTPKAYAYEVAEIEILPAGQFEERQKIADSSRNSGRISGAKLLEGVGKSYEKGKNLLVESEKSDFSLQNRGETEENVGSGVRFREEKSKALINR